MCGRERERVPDVRAERTKSTEMACEWAMRANTENPTTKTRKRKRSERKNGDNSSTQLTQTHKLNTKKKYLLTRSHIQFSTRIFHFIIRRTWWCMRACVTTCLRVVHRMSSAYTARHIIRNYAMNILLPLSSFSALSIRNATHRCVNVTCSVAVRMKWIGNPGETVWSLMRCR